MASCTSELAKIAGLGGMWQNFLDVFRPEDSVKARRRVEYHFSPKSGPDRWVKFERNVGSPEFVNWMQDHPLADEKLVAHTQSMHALGKAKPIGKIQSSRIPGKTYEIRQLGERLGCTCNDWRFRGTVNPGYDCKHIGAFRDGKVKAEEDVVR